MQRESMKQRSFTGKLLLIGEHSVLEGSMAIVLPYPEVTANLQFGEILTDCESRDSNEMILQFHQWLKQREPHILDLKRLEEDLRDGLFCRSTIPPGYGLGSSGALCAALYAEYGHLLKPLDKTKLQDIKNDLASMESFFHGKSSGIDPLCIYFNQPLVIHGNSMVTPWNFSHPLDGNIRFFLIDTGYTGKTKDLVLSFRKKLVREDLSESFTQQYIPLVGRVVETFVNEEPDMELLYELSVFQMRIFTEMIPEEFMSMWQYGLDSGYYGLKLCGSGGGGYLLGFTDDMVRAAEELDEKFRVKILCLSSLVPCP